MTVVRNKNTQAVTAEKIFERYTGFGGDITDMKMGGEVERVYYRADDPHQMMDWDDQIKFLDALPNYTIDDPKNPGAKKSVTVTEETVSQVLEEQTSAYKWGDMAQLLQEERDKAAVMQEIAHNLGLRQSPFTANPLVTHDQCWENPNVGRWERTDMLVEQFHKHMSHDALSYTFLTSPVHCSVSYTNPEHLWGMARRMYYLTPFMYLAGDNGSGFIERGEKPLNHHFTMRTNQALEDRGGVPEFFFRCMNGEDFIRGHIEAVMNNPMFIYFDESGETVKAEGDDLPTFRDLEALGLNTQSNFDLAESMLWPDGKICNIRDDNDVPVGKRFEIRMWDTGPHQFQSMMLTCMATLMDPQGAAETDALLEDYGFGEVPFYSRDLLEEAYQNALYHNGHYMDIPFGKKREDGSQPTMLDFAGELYPIIERSVLRTDPELLPKLEPLKHICETGWTDTKVIQNLYGDLKGVEFFMKNAPDDIYTRPDGVSYYQLWMNDELPEYTPPENGSDLKSGQHVGFECLKQDM